MCVCSHRPGKLLRGQPGKPHLKRSRNTTVISPSSFDSVVGLLSRERSCVSAIGKPTPPPTRISSGRMTWPAVQQEVSSQWRGLNRVVWRCPRLGVRKRGISQVTLLRGLSAVDGAIGQICNVRCSEVKVESSTCVKGRTHVCALRLITCGWLARVVDDVESGPAVFIPATLGDDVSP